MATQDKSTTPAPGKTTGNGSFVQPGNAQENEALVRRMFSMLNEHNTSKVLPFQAENVTITSIPLNKTWQGHAGFTEFLNGWIQAFPDYKLELTNVVATADKCVVEFTARATHSGTLHGPMGSIPATNKRVELRFSEFYEIQNGRITRSREYFDMGSLMTQLGLLKKM